MPDVKKISGCWDLKHGQRRIRCEPKYYRDDLCKEVVVGDTVYVVGLAIEFVVAAVETKESGKVWYTPAEGSVVMCDAEDMAESQQQMQRSARTLN